MSQPAKKITGLKPAYDVQRITMVPVDVPVFVGFTSSGNIAGGPVLVNSLADFQHTFGKLDPLIDVEISGTLTARMRRNGFLEESLRLFFLNGGKRCYVISAGTPYASSQEARLLEAIALSEFLQEASLLVCPDAVLLDALEATATVQRAMLEVCDKKQACMALLDLPLDEEATTLEDLAGPFREALGTAHLRYGVAFHPWVRTTHHPGWSTDQVRVRGKRVAPADWCRMDRLNADIETCMKNLREVFGPQTPEEALAHCARQPAGEECPEKVLLETLFSKVEELVAMPLSEPVRQVLWTFISEDGFWHELVRSAQVTARPADGSEERRLEGKHYEDLLQEAIEALYVLKGCLRYCRDEAHQQLRDADPLFDVMDEAVTEVKRMVPPSGLMAGMYAATARVSGVWTAPEQCRMRGVEGPTEVLNNFEQEWLHTDSVTGKSINAIRAFDDTGTMAWGARTLDGLDARWRYASVTRLAGLVKQSLTEALGWLSAVPEPHVYRTEVLHQVATFLDELWEQGAFKGAAARQAYFVRAGSSEMLFCADALRSTLTLQVGIAIVRPNDFTTFSLELNGSR